MILSLKLETAVDLGLDNEDEVATGLSTRRSPSGFSCADVFSEADEVAARVVDTDVEGFTSS